MAVPKRPEYFRIGIINKDTLVDDPKYWLGKDLQPLDERGQRQRRIKYLRKRNEARMGD